MVIKNFVVSMIKRSIVPLFMWLKLLIMLVLPALMYLYNWWAFFVIFGALSLLFAFFPEKWVKCKNQGFMYHVTRGLIMEFEGGVTYITPCFQKLLDTQLKKIIAWALFLTYMMISLGVCASKNLVLGVFMFYPCVLVLFRVIVEYRDVSENIVEFVTEADEFQE